MHWAASKELNQVYRRLVKMALDELQLIEQQMDQLDHEIADLLSQHQAAVQRLAEVPGLGVDSAHQIIAEVGAAAATFPSEKHLASWVGVCPGEEESAGVSASNRSPKGNRFMRRLLNQAANAAVKVKGSIFEIVFRRLLPRLGYQQAIWAIAHRLCRLIWKILHQGVRYDERGPAVSQKSRGARTAKMIREDAFKSFAAGRSDAGAVSEIGIDNLHGLPAQAVHPLGHVILKTLALLVLPHLFLAGLAQVDDRFAR
jgi:transposase